MFKSLLTFKTKVNIEKAKQTKLRSAGSSEFKFHQIPVKFNL